MSDYDPIASLYDRHWGTEFSRVARHALETYLVPRLPIGGAVLDLCCGTGLMLAQLESLGYSVFGVDESPNMLAIARCNAPGAQLQQADMAHFSWGERFDAGVSFYNSLNHARSLEHLRATLLNVANHMKAGGSLLFDYVLPEAFETAWEWCEQIGGWTFRYTYDRSTGQATCLINQAHQIRQTAFQPGQIQEALSAAGFDVVCETAMTGSGPSGGRRLLLARKQ